MRAGREYARSRGVQLQRGERIERFGDGWLIFDRSGFTPCPWAFEVTDFIPLAENSRVLDLGTGTGALLIALHQTHPEMGPCIGVELDAHTADQAKRNFILQGIQQSQVLVEDLRSMPRQPEFDLVLANPPFYPKGWGRVSEDSAKARATHALYGDVKDFAVIAAQSVKPDGRVVFVFDGSRARDVLIAFGEAGLTVQGLRFLEDDRGQAARVVVLGGQHDSGVTVEVRPHADQRFPSSPDKSRTA